MFRGEQAERFDKGRQVLPAFEGSDRGDVRTAEKYRDRRIGRWRGDGQRGERDHRHPRLWEQIDDLRCGRRGTGVNRRAMGDRSTEHTSGLLDRADGKRRIAEEPAVVHRYHLCGTARRHHVVGAMHDIGAAEESIEAGTIGNGPQAMGRQSRQG